MGKQIIAVEPRPRFTLRPLSRRGERHSMIRELTTGFVATQGPRAPRAKADIVTVDLDLESVPDVTLSSREHASTIR